MADYKKVESDIKEKLVAINRITKVVKGGRRFGFAALMVVGNQKGSIGILKNNIYLKILLLKSIVNSNKKSRKLNSKYLSSSN